jgi:hypothetical protein
MKEARPLKENQERGLDVKEKATARGGLTLKGKVAQFQFQRTVMEETL